MNHDTASAEVSADMVPQVRNAALPTAGAIASALAQVLDNPVELEAIRARKAKLDAFWDEFMVPVDPATQKGDYGVQPGTKSVTLRLSGGQKLKGFFNVTDRPRIAHRIEDFDRRLIHYEAEVDIISRFTGEVLETGMGSCNSFESKYRYRTAQRACPECNAHAIQRSKYGLKGWWCSDRIGGCKAEFKKDDPRITDQQIGRTENPDVLDQVNTCLRMAKKRGFLDAMVQLVRACGRDVEAEDDTDDGGDAGGRDDAREEAGNGGKRGGDKIETITEEQHRQILEAGKAARHKPGDLLGWVRDTYKIDLTKQRLPREHFDAVLKRASDVTPLAPSKEQFGF